MTKRSIRGLTVVLLAMVFGICALHLAVTAGLRRIRTSAFGAFNRAAAGQVNAELLVTGSSRAALHYDPAILTRSTGLTAFNLGRIGAASVSIHIGILRAYLHTNRPPRVAIENADFQSLDALPGMYDVPEYTPYLGEDALYQGIRRRNPDIWKARWLPLYGYLVDDVEYRHYLGIKALFGFTPPENYENGYLRHDAPWRPDPNTPKHLRYEMNSAGLEDYEEFLAETYTRGIAAIVVFSPTYHTLNEKAEGKLEVMARMASLAARHQAVFWDYSSFEPITDSTDYFSDAWHMNRRGATVFSEALGRRLAAWLAAQHYPGAELPSRSAR